MIKTTIPILRYHSVSTDPAPWIEAGATWCLTGFGMEQSAADVRAAIDI